MRASRRRVTLALIGLFVAVYGLWQAGPYLHGPSLEVREPVEGALVREERIAVKGTAANISRLTLDGRPIFMDEKGMFEEDFLLARGATVLEIRGADKFGRERVVRRMVYRP